MNKCEKNILEFNNVNFFYGKKQILNDVTFNIKKGEFFVLLGLNGVGKSTIFSLITRLLKLEDGKIFINGESIENYTKSLKDIGVVFQEATLDLDLTVKQNLYYYGALKGLAFEESLESIKKEIEKLNLDKFLDTPARNLSGGQRRKVEILRALINKPKLLLLDEPTVGLDLKARFDILDYVRQLVKYKNLSVLWISHLFDEVENKDSIALIKNGEIIEQTKVENLLLKYEQKNLVDIFNEIME
ncbi:ABC transporter ATP-binding protein [Halarcobacter mediterraneus]|uniref:ABC transporter ATP-binding protein n=1 Tax=Halarcobacter mediterraneus TaxID=2023153 RepID=A0A4V1M1C5_9BACT|nr:ATP-binding cassette domain-containing protein [Halarcobacter mediterraneus]RXK13184.1 ABC transporter ATP-binding protein [Halarcobacter mediterraneus]